MTIGENMKKIILIITACTLVLFNINVSAKKSAEPEILGEAEIPSSLLRISKDGTGIIKFRQCDECKMILVKVTPATIFYLNGNKISAAQAKKLSRPGFIGIQYTLDSNEVRTIGFAN